MSTFPLSTLGRGWLAIDSADTPMHMGALLYLSLPGDAPSDWVARLAEQWRQSTEVQHPWNLHLASTPFPSLHGKWLPDDDIELDYHFRHSALPNPGGEREMGELVSRLHGRGLDLSRPPWECHLIEGLQDGRFAIYVKVHAALLTGPDFLDVLLNRFSSQPGQDPRAPWTVPAVLPHPQSLATAWPKLLGPLRRRVRDALFSSLPWAGLRHAPRSALNDQINGLRRFATQDYPRSRLQAVGRNIGASEEEVIYFLVASAVRRFFREFNALPDRPLIALVADRSRRDRQLLPLLISLGTHRANRRKRLREIRESLRVARGMASARSADLARAEASADVLPYVFRQLMGVDHRLSPLFNLGIVHYEGAADRRYLGDATVESVFPMPMLLQGSALAIASLTYADKISVGLCGARDTLPHLQRMAVYMEGVLQQLEAEGLDDE